MKVQGTRSKMKVYEDSDFFNNGFTSYLSYQDKEVGTYDYDSYYNSPITDEEVNKLFGCDKEEKFELSHRGMTITQVIDKLKDIADSAEYCEIEGYLSRAIVLLEQYRDMYAFINKE